MSAPWSLLYLFSTTVEAGVAGLPLEASPGCRGRCLSHCREGALWLRASRDECALHRDSWTRWTCEASEKADVPRKEAG